MAVEVGDQADGVRQPGALPEGRAALVVDEHEAHLVGPVRYGEAGDEGLQQLGLAGPGRPRHQRVRPVTSQVEHARLPSDADAHRDPSAARVDPPGGLEHGRIGRVDVQEVEKLDAVRQTGPDVLRSRIAKWRQRAGEATGPPFVDSVGHDTLVRRVLGGDPQPRPRVAADLDRRAALGGQRDEVAVAADQDDPGVGTLGQQTHHTGEAA